MNISLPLFVDLKNECLGRCDSVTQSIDSFLELLLNTPCHSCVSDPYFGFLFTNLRFEIFNETDGVVNFQDKDTIESAAERALYEKKISGTSKNLNTFATDLKIAIEKYEKRLTDVSTIMSYVRDQKSIHITIKGTIEQSQTEYQYITMLSVWN